jgi:hypothetical protein
MMSKICIVYVRIAWGWDWWGGSISVTKVAVIVGDLIDPIETQYAAAPVVKGQEAKYTGDNFQADAVQVSSDVWSCRSGPPDRPRTTVRSMPPW